jgi:ParB family chromosome partitioning protein
MSKKALGRGLSALFPQAASLDADLVHIGVDQIDPAAGQPRKRFDDAKLEELAQSIKASGLIQPLVVRRSGDRFQLIAGERRWRAAGRAGLLKVPCIIKQAADDDALELSLIENVQREDLNPIEEATAYKSLLERIGLTQDQIAHRIGKDRSSVANSLRLLKLPREVQALVEEDKISMGHARALLALATAAQQIELANTIVSKALSVRQAEQLTRPTPARPNRPIKNDLAGERANILAAESKLRKRLGSPVKIKLLKEGGIVEIKFSSMEDLTRLFDQLMQKK